MSDEFQEWVAELTSELGETEAVPVDELLKIARTVAHRVDRRAAPVTTYLIGLAAGRAGGSSSEVLERMSTARRLAEARPAIDG